jgi:hypothetical protein
MAYVFDGFMSSIFLWKGCWVGVAAETETVDELCMTVSLGQKCSSAAYHSQARRSRPHPTSISELCALPDRGRDCVEPREFCSLEEGRSLRGEARGRHD